MDVDLGRFHGFMAQPKRDHRLVDTAMQELHRGAVAKGVRRDAFSSEAWTGLRGQVAVFSDQMFECVSAKAISSDRREEGAEAFFAITDPTLDEFGRIAPQRRSAVFSGF